MLPVCGGSIQQHRRSQRSEDDGRHQGQFIISTSLGYFADSSEMVGSVRRAEVVLLCTNAESQPSESTVARFLRSLILFLLLLLLPLFFCVSCYYATILF